MLRSVGYLVLWSVAGDISPPAGVRAAMEMQAEAERRRRAQVLESEGDRQANINTAEGKKAAVILQSEAALTDQVNRAKGTPPATPLPGPPPPLPGIPCSLPATRGFLPLAHCSRSCGMGSCNMCAGSASSFQGAAGVVMPR